MPISVLQVFNDLGSEWHWFAPIDQIAAAIHNHVSDHLLAVAEFLDKVAQKRVEIELKIDEVLLKQESHYFDRC